MLNIFLTSSKYLLIVLFAFYTYYAFNTLRNTGEEYKSCLIKRQRVMLFLLHLLSYTIILIYNIDRIYTVILFYGAQLIYFILLIGLTGVFFEMRINLSLLNNMNMLISIGLIVLSRISLDKAIRQFYILIFATFIFFIILFFFNRIGIWSKAAWVYCVLGIGLLLLVLVMGELSNGAKLAINFTFFSIQPLEFVKIIYIFFLASLFQKENSTRLVIKSGIFAGIHVILLVLSRDLGSALILFVAYLLILYVTGKKILYLLSGLVGGAIASIAGYALFSHVRVRVLAWQNPWSVIDNEGYQITQSLFAIGTGGWLGMGLFRGRPTDIPVVEQDFVFSAISEELGGFFALCLIFLYLACFMNFIRISMKQKEGFYKILVLGFSIIWGIQIFLTIGGAIKLIPSTGVTLPLISYGGSSLVSTVIMFAIILSVDMKNNSSEIEEKENAKKTKEKRK